MSDEHPERAFPFTYKTEAAGPPATVTHFGMTLRDYFAATALKVVAGDPWYADQNVTYKAMAPSIAKDCYTIADAMLAERAK